MNGSPLQLGRYFVTECKVTANKQFDQERITPLDAQILEVEPVCKSLDNVRHWEITVRIKFQPGPETNTPYYFTLETVGFFQVMPDYPEEKVEMLARTNGPSMLYGIAREVVREMTGRGPYPQMFLPSVVFPPTTAIGAATEFMPRSERSEKPSTSVPAPSRRRESVASKR